MTQVCPQCKSEDISADLSARSGFGMGSMDMMRCNACGHAGTFFPILD